MSDFSFAVSPPLPGEERYTYDRLEVLRVVDGDTVWMRVGLPFNLSLDVDVRLVGINAPERVGATRAAGDAARDHLTGLLSASTELRARSYKTDKYGRFLWQVWGRLPSGWRNLNLAMIQDGHAIPYNP